MSFSSGVFSINSAGQPVVTGTVISSTAFNALTADLATGLSACVLKDGTQTITGNIPMSSFKFTGLGAGSAAGNSLRYEQLVASGTIIAQYLAGSTQGFSMVNGTLVASQNGTVLTVAVKTLAGSDPSATDPVYVLFRSATVTASDYTVITISAANSIATTVGGTFGIANGVAFNLWITGHNDGGTFRLGLINCVTTVAGAGAGRDVTSIFQLGQFPIASSTQIGVGSTSAGVFYTAGAAVTSKAYSVLGYLYYGSGLATAGTFGVNQTRAHMQKVGDPLPGQTVQLARNETGVVATGTTTVPFDNTIPQSTEGDQYMTQAATAGSAANVWAINMQGNFAWNTTGQSVMNLHQDATANALGSTYFAIQNANAGYVFPLSKKILAAATASTTFKMRMGGSSAGTISFNGEAGSQFYGGVLNSYMEVTELQG